MVIGGVTKADGRVNELLVNLRAKEFFAEPLVGHALRAAREYGDEGRAVGAGEVEAIGKLRERQVALDPGVDGRAKEIGEQPGALKSPGLVDAEGREQRSGRGVCDDGDVAVGPGFAEGLDDRRGEDEVADAFDLDEEDFHWVRRIARS